jgi:hypothetical protein
MLDLLYHVIAHGNDGQKIFLRQSNYRAFIEALRSVRQCCPFFLYAYVLMSLDCAPRLPRDQQLSIECSQ